MLYGYQNQSVNLGEKKISCSPGIRTPGRPAHSLISNVVYVKGHKFQLILSSICSRVLYSCDSDT